MSETEFRQLHAELADLTLDEHRRYLHVEPCECDHPDCIGWATIPVTQWKREQREARRTAVLSVTPDPQRKDRT